jgi:hypothetical protein
MRKLLSLTAVGIFVLTLVYGGPAATQSASPDQMTAARELVTAMRATDQFKAIFPVLMQQLKPGIVRGRPEVERDYDTMIPAMLEIFNARSDEIVESMAAIYARNFTVDEMQQVVSFYRTPIGQKLLDKLPVIFQESVAAGNKFGQAVATELRDRLIEELRKRGHNI